MVGWHHQLSAHEFKQNRETVEDRGDWPAAVHGVTKSLTPLSDQQHCFPDNNMML